MSDPYPVSCTEAPKNCRRGFRLVDLRKSLSNEHPDWWNAPVPAFGDPAACPAMAGLSNDRFQSRLDDGVILNSTIILNAVLVRPTGKQNHNGGD